MDKKEYQTEIAKGNIGQIEYKLHKNKTWVAQYFTSIDDMRCKLNLLKINGYNIDLIIYFEYELLYWNKTYRLVNLLKYLKEKESSRAV